MEASLFPVFPDVVGPAQLTRMPVDSVEGSRTRADKDELTGDRRRSKHSACRVELPQDLRRRRVHLGNSCQHQAKRDDVLAVPHGRYFTSAQLSRSSRRRAALRRAIVHEVRCIALPYESTLPVTLQTRLRKRSTVLVIRSVINVTSLLPLPRVEFWRRRSGDLAGRSMVDGSSGADRFWTRISSPGRRNSE